MWPSNSSDALRPLTSSSAARASAKSARTNSSDNDPPSANAAARADQGAMRAIDERDVPDVGDRRVVGDSIDVECGNDPTAQLTDPCPGQSRDRHGLVVVPDRDAVTFICNAKHFS